MKPDISTELAGIKLKNPTVLASGILGNTGKILKRVAEAGAGALTTKSISPQPRKGHKNPIIVELDNCMLNAVGLPNPGADAFVNEIRTAKESGIPIIANVVASDLEGYVKSAEKLSEAEPDMFEINASCPNVEKGMDFARDPDAAAELTKAVKKVIKVPLSFKVTPNADKLVEVAQAVEKAGVDAITAINTLGPGMMIDIETTTPILSNKTGGLSGELLKPIAVNCVYKIYQAVKIPIIGTGGISSGEDALQHIMAGASAVGIGTAIKEDINVFSKVSQDIKEFMIRKSFKTLKELIGIAHKEV